MPLDRVQYIGVFKELHAVEQWNEQETEWNEFESAEILPSWLDELVCFEAIHQICIYGLDFGIGVAKLETRRSTWFVACGELFPW
jgi:hypothetical protein